MDKIVVTGGFGFIGTNLIMRLREVYKSAEIVIVDNFSGNYPHSSDFFEKFRVFKCTLEDKDALNEIFYDTDVVYHLSANSDIAKSAKSTFLDVQQTVLNTYNLLEVLRQHKVKKLIYTSGSGVYGDIGETYPDENFGPLLPVSLYGATKLSAEALISAYSNLFDIKSVIFRFANVVGPYQTHGVSYDFVNKLNSDHTTLGVLGNGLQSKSYVHVSDVVDAMLLMLNHINEDRTQLFNISSGDYITVKDIVSIVLAEMCLSNVNVIYQEVAQGWPGDVPVVRFNDNKIRRLGWQNKFSSAQAITESVRFQLKHG